MHEPMQIDKFVTELRQKSKNCEFGMSEDDMMRDKIVFSVTEKLLREPNLTLQKAIDICRASEIAKERINIMASAKKESEVHAFDVTKGAKYKNKPVKAIPSHNKKEKVSGTSKACTRCGQTPAPRSCPAYGAKCRAFGDISGVHVIADDMIIAAIDEKEHTEILHKVMDRAKELNIKFNADKIQYKVTKVRYMDHIISAEGGQPDSEKVEAIVNMPTPEDKKGLQRLLGMTKYLSQYIKMKQF